MTTADDVNGLQAWCYDALVKREWTWDSANVVLRRSADLVWMIFESNPASFCSVIRAIQPIEVFLAEGPPMAVPDAIRTGIATHLQETRHPGVSTWLSIVCELQGPVDCRLIAVNLSLPDYRLDEVPIPGPDHAGLYDWPLPAPRHEVRRLLVAPGPVALTVSVSVNGPPAGAPTVNRIETATATIPIEAPAQACTPVLVVVDARDWPALVVRSGC